MSLLMNDRRKKDAAITIVAGFRAKEDSKDSGPEDQIKLAAYELADKAGWHITDMCEFIECWKRLHKFVHEFEDNKGPEIEF